MLHIYICSSDKNWNFFSRKTAICKGWRCESDNFFFVIFRVLTLLTLTSGFMTGSLGGGGQIDHPLIFLIVIQINNNWYVFGNPLGSTSAKICKKMADFQKSKYLLRNQFLKQNIVQTKIPQIEKNYTFLKSPSHSKFKCAKTINFSHSL